MKQIFLKTIIVCLIVIFSGCSGNSNSDEEFKENDELFFLKWKAYYGCFEDEIPRISLLVIDYNKKYIENNNIFNNIRLLSDKIEINTKTISVNKEVSAPEFDLYYINLELPNFNVGIYNLKSITLSVSEKDYNIGEWVFEVKKGIKPKHIYQKGYIIRSGEISNYFMGLRNDSKNVIEINDITFKLPDIKLNSEIIYNEEKMKVNSKDKSRKIILNENELIEFDMNFSFDKDFNIYRQIICLKPFIEYTINDQKITSSLNRAEYIMEFILENIPFEN